MSPKISCSIHTVLTGTQFLPVVDYMQHLVVRALSSMFDSYLLQQVVLARTLIGFSEVAILCRKIKLKHYYTNLFLTPLYIYIQSQRTKSHVSLFP